MKIQFCFNRDFDSDNNVIAEFDVAEMPTEGQCEAIEEYIYNEIDKWYEENDGDFAEFDYWWVCREAARKNLELVNNPVVKTFYL